jgi:DnaJ-class molecular chaperone
MMNNQQYEAWKAQPCQCVICHGCSGEGRISISQLDTEICDECDGNRVIQPCERCLALEEMDDAPIVWVS